MTDESDVPDDDPALYPDIERAVIGACFLDVAAATLALANLTPEHFDDHKARDAFRAIQRNTPEGGHPDPVVVFEELRGDPSSNGSADWTARTLEVPTAANQQRYVERVLRRYAARRMAQAAKNLSAAAGTAGRLWAERQLAEAQALPLRIADENAEKPFAPVGAYDLLQTSLPPVVELVSPRVLYRGGVTVLVASHKRGKSLASLGLCVDLVINIATPVEQRFGGTCPKWLGQDVVGAGPVLVYSAEGGERMIQERLRKLVPDAREWLNDLKVYARKPTPQLDQRKDLDGVFAHAEATGSVLLVFDPLGRFWAMEEEADPTQARNLMEAIQTRAEAAYGGDGIAVLIIHHDTKTGGSDDSAVTGGRGSGKFGDDADALINLKIVQGDEPGASIAKFLLRHAESPAPVPVKIDRNTLRLVERRPQDQRSGPAKGGRPPKLSLGALENLIRAKGQIEAIRVADELQVSDSAWEKNRKRMVNALVEADLISTKVLPGTVREVLVWEGVVAETAETAPWEPK